MTVVLTIKNQSCTESMGKPSTAKKHEISIGDVEIKEKKKNKVTLHFTKNNVYIVNLTEMINWSFRSLWC